MSFNASRFAVARSARTFAFKVLGMDVIQKIARHGDNPFIRSIAARLAVPTALPMQRHGKSIFLVLRAVSDRTAELCPQLADSAEE
jgi:hypothetical protein